MTKLILTLMLTFPILVMGNAPKSNKSLDALKITSPIKIDGNLDEEVWSKVIPANGFTQSNPLNGVAPSYQTEVKIIYDNSSIYIGAFMYDDHADSILTQLGDRDDNLNADKFMVKFDTYNSKIDAFNFEVFASGVQKDYRFEDYSFNAVWDSEVKIHKNGWSVEMRIPFSAIRFPSSEKQSWTIQFQREIRRKREIDVWNFVPRDVDNFMNYWGTLDNLENIEPPLRLSLSPYISAYGEHDPIANDETNGYARTFSGGMDLKYGITEGLTLDMTLLPDFSAVQSDNYVKNLSPFEVVYQENRPFFQEGTELFSYGDLFYSRRIGGTPIDYYSLPYMLNEGDSILSNPSTTKLLNATKISGRTSNGIGVGFFNSITEETTASVQRANGDIENITTSPLTNYNISVIDKNLGNNNNVYLINTNVLRAGDSYYDANVTGAGFTWNNKKNTYMVDGDVSYSHKTDGSEDGYEYYTSFNKTSGVYKFYFNFSGTSPNYDMNDLALTFDQGVRRQSLTVSRGQYEPLWIFNNGGTTLNFYTRQRWDSLSPNWVNIHLHNWGMLKKSFTFMWFGAQVTPKWYYDYREPRAAGRYVYLPGDKAIYGGFSTNYAKPFALDGSIRLMHAKWFNDIPIIFADVTPIFRFSNHFQMSYNINYEYMKNFVGFATFDYDHMNGNPVFGERTTTTVSNLISAKYIFKNNLSLNLRVRHYWSQGLYNRYFDLQEDGSLLPSEYSETIDFSFNTFNIDAVFNWQFAPGSNLIITYKNAIFDEFLIFDRNELGNGFVNYGNNLTNTLKLPQKNSLAIKLLYYIDYEQMTRAFGK